MTETGYDLRYFDRYLRRRRFGRRVLGDKGVAFWTAHVRKAIGEGARLLEVGAGTGHFGAEAAKHFDYVGTDLSQAAVTWSRENLGLDLQVADAQVLPFDDASFDGVVAFDLVEHLPDPDAFLREAHRVLRPNGYLHLRTPNTRSFGVKVKAGHPTLVPSMYQDTTHCSLLDPEAWLAAVQRAGFTVTRKGTDGLWDLPYSTAVPVLLQKAVLLPLNAALHNTVGSLPWTLGENLILDARRHA